MNQLIESNSIFDDLPSEYKFFQRSENMYLLYIVTQIKLLILTTPRISRCQN